MNLCLQEAWKYQGLTYPNPAVGSLILDQNKKLIAIDAHKRAGNAHAELAVISQALAIMGDSNIADIKNSTKKHQYILDNHRNKFKDFTIFVTLEPCNHQGSTPPCSILIKTLGFKKVLIGSMDPNIKATGGAKLLENSGMIVDTGILQKECNQLIEPFLKWQSNKPYIFFKLAKSANGVYTGGTISGKESRTYVHKLREVINLLAIGGNSVRIDKPILDCRLTGADSPDIFIYSKENNFDRNIPLFSVQNREVIVSNSLERLNNYKYIMIEGGEGMLKSVIHIIDHLLIFTSPNFKTGKTLQLDLKLDNLYNGKIGLDNIEWFKII